MGVWGLSSSNYTQTAHCTGTGSRFEKAFRPCTGRIGCISVDCVPTSFPPVQTVQRTTGGSVQVCSCGTDAQPRNALIIPYSGEFVSWLFSTPLVLGRPVLGRLVYKIEPTFLVAPGRSVAGQRADGHEARGGLERWS